MYFILVYLLFAAILSSTQHLHEPRHDVALYLLFLLIGLSISVGYAIHASHHRRMR